MKNWSGKKEVIETSGRLHPIMTTKQTTPYAINYTDWMHTRQDKWIQTELAFTLAKKYTEPNIFEIICLQPTRKENNWKTEQTLVRAVVTLQTEWIKGSSPWCLWWWCTHSILNNMLGINIINFWYIFCFKLRNN
jgi:hypothetical protein